MFTSVAIAVNSVQDQITYLYRDFSEKSKEIEWSNIDDGSDILETFTIDENYGPQINDILEDGTIIEFKSNDMGDFGIYKALDGNLSYTDFLKRKVKGRPPEMIFIENLTGFMLFPIIPENSSFDGYLIYYKLDLNSVIREYLPSVVKDLLDNPLKIPQDQQGDIRSDDVGSFSTGVYTGQELNNGNLAYEADLVIDLNRLFNLTRIFDYHFGRLDRDYIYFEKNKNLIDDHLYLMIHHETGNLERFFGSKRHFYYTGLSILYLTIVCSIISFVYTTFRVRKSVLREKEFTALISHELKTPLSVIKLGADNLASGVVEKKSDVIEYGEMIQGESYRLKEMIEKILTISTSIESLEYSIFEHADITGICDQLADLCRSLARKTGVEIKLQLNNRRDTIYCNEKALTGALFNILQNSIVYGASFAEQKVVEIAVSDSRRRGRNGIVFLIRDFGPGISWKEAQMIFRPFYRGSFVRKQQISGSGLGLSISRKIIKQHKGQLNLVRNLRKETVFEVWLPNRMNNEKDTSD